MNFNNDLQNQIINLQTEIDKLSNEAGSLINEYIITNDKYYYNEATRLNTEMENKKGLLNFLKQINEQKIEKYNNNRVELVEINKKITKVEKNLKNAKEYLDDLIKKDEDFDEINEVEKLIKIENDALNTYLNEKKSLEDTMNETEIYKNYNIKNPLVNYKNRDMILNLTKKMDDDKIKQLFRVSKNYFVWKNHFLFIKNHWEPGHVTLLGRIHRISQHTFRANKIFDGIILNDAMPVNSGIYLLKIKILYSNTKMEIKFHCDKYLKISHKDDVTISNNWVKDYNNSLKFYNRKWKVNDYLNFVIDTNNRIISYLIRYNDEENNNDNYSKDLKYNIKEPLKVIIWLAKENCVLNLVDFGKLSS
jgi:hypothetical protein